MYRAITTCLAPAAVASDSGNDDGDFRAEPLDRTGGGDRDRLGGRNRDGAGGFQCGVERIEIVRGPATLVYGSNAAGGHINGESPKCVVSPPRQRRGGSFRSDSRSSGSAPGRPQDAETSQRHAQFLSTVHRTPGGRGRFRQHGAGVVAVLARSAVVHRDDPRLECRSGSGYGRNACLECRSDSGRPGLCGLASLCLANPVLVTVVRAQTGTTLVSNAGQAPGTDETLVSNAGQTPVDPDSADIHAQLFTTGPVEPRIPAHLD